MSKIDCFDRLRIRRALIVAAILTILALVPSISFSSDSSGVETFVSFNGQFKIEIPAGWMRMDYRTVDYYLRQTSQADELLDYEAVFSTDKRGLFYNREYLLLTVDTVGEMSRRQIDSVLADMSEAFEVKIERRTITNFATDLKAGTFFYDDQLQVGAIATEVYDAGKVSKISLLVVKFYNMGMANFYFYAPIDDYTKASEQFYQITSSFDTTGLKEVSPEPLPVTKIDDEKSMIDEPTKWVVLLGLFIVIIVVIARRRKSKAEHGN